jgi:hypothetical protein
MFCSGCGQALAPGQAFCPHCGRPTVPVVPPVPGLQFQLESFAGKVKTLSVFWFIYAGLYLLLGFFGLVFARTFLSGAFGHWMRGPLPLSLFGPAILHLAWLLLVVRSLLDAASGWGLMEHAPWGRPVAIVAAVFNLLNFPFGTALAIWTLIVLLGYRNSALYEQL